MKNLKTISLLLIASILLFSCGENEKKSSNKSEGLEMANLLTEELVRTTFNVYDTVTLEPDFGTVAKNYIQYKWQIDSSENVLYYYSVTLNFAKGEPSTSSQLEAMWNSQNEGVYKDKDMEEVSGIGQKASWSTLGGGQLRVVSDRYMFYLSLSGKRMEVDIGDFNTTTEWSKEYRIEKGTSLAKEIITKL